LPRLPQRGHQNLCPLRYNLFLFREQNVPQSAIGSYDSPLWRAALLHCILKGPKWGARLPAPIIRSGEKLPWHQGVGAVYVHGIAHAAADQKDNI